MNAVVEVVTAEAVAQTTEVTVATRVIRLLEALTPVTASTLRSPVVSMGSHSISAIAPDAHSFERTLACA